MHRVRLNSPPQDEPDGTFEEDLGMMGTADKSLDNCMQPVHDENFPNSHSDSTYPLLVPLERSKSQQLGPNSDPVIQNIIARTTGIFSSNLTAPPLFPIHSQPHRKSGIDSTFQSQTSSNDTDQNSQSDKNILQLIGDGNSVVRTVKLIQSARHLRQQVLTMLISKSNRTNSSITKSESVIATDATISNEASNRPDSIPSQNLKDLVVPQNSNKSNSDCTPQSEKSGDLFEIRNEVDKPASTSPVDRSNSWEISVIRGACAMLLSLSGFSDCSQHALDILVDLMIYFIRDVGRNLVLIGDEGETGIVALSEQLQVISGSGFRGSLPDLLSYRKMDLVRMEQAAVDAKSRLEMHLEAVKRAIGFANTQTTAHEVVTTPKRNNTLKDEDTAEEETTSASTEQNLVNLNSEAFAFGYLNKRVRLDVLGGIRVPLPLVYDEVRQLDIGDFTANDESGTDIVPAHARNSTRVKAEAQLDDANRWTSDIF